MTTEAIVLMVITLAVVWGGLIAAILFLRAKPERDDLPEGGEDAPEPTDPGTSSP